MNLKIRLELFEKELLSLPLRIVRFDMLFQVQARYQQFALFASECSTARLPSSLYKFR